MKELELLEVLKSHQSITRVELSKVDNAKSFWGEFSNKVYLLSFWNWSATSILDFQHDDTLELVNSKGKLFKRLKRYLKESRSIELNDSEWGVIGDMLQSFVNDSQVFYVDFTDTFNWSDGQFGKGGSCWWGTYEESLPTFEDNGGYCIRFYNDENQNNSNGIGRTWLYPYNGYLIGFNSYGVSRPNVSKVIKAIFAQHGIELHYKVINVENSQNDEIPYINGGSGFVLYSNENPYTWESFDLDMEVEGYSRYTCDSCGARLDEDNVWRDDFNCYCESCYNERYFYCYGCENEYSLDDRAETDDTKWLCESCAREDGYIECYECSTWTKDYSITDDDTCYCEGCIKYNAHYCEDCNKWIEGIDYCPTCKENNLEDDDIVTSEEDIVITGKNEGESFHLKTYRLKDDFGLFIYKWEDRTLTISHEVSHLAAITGIKSLDKAIECLKRLKDVMNWNLPAGELTSLPEFEIARKIIMEYR